MTFEKCVQLQELPVFVAHCFMIFVPAFIIGYSIEQAFIQFDEASLNSWWTGLLQLLVNILLLFVGAFGFRTMAQEWQSTYPGILFAVGLFNAQLAFMNRLGRPLDKLFMK